MNWHRNEESIGLVGFVLICTQLLQEWEKRPNALCSSLGSFKSFVSCVCAKYYDKIEQEKEVKSNRYVGFDHRPTYRPV